MVTDTSLMAYYGQDFDTQQQTILYCIQHTVKPTSKSIAKMTRLDRTSVTGRLKELEKKEIIRKSDEKIIDPTTGRKVYYYLEVTAE